MLLVARPAAGLLARRVQSAAPALFSRVRRQPLAALAFKGEHKESEPEAKSAEVAPAAPSKAEKAVAHVRQPRSSVAHPARRMSDMLTEMQRELDTLFDVIMSPRASALMGGPRTPLDVFDAMLPAMPAAEEVWLGAPASRPMALQVDQDEHAYYLHAEVPGFSKDEVKIRLSSDNVLTVEAEHREEASDKDKAGQVTRMMRRASSFRRSVALPDNIDADKISASTKDGMLVVTVPKAPVPEVKHKEIKVQ